MSITTKKTTTLLPSPLTFSILSLYIINGRSWSALYSLHVVMQNGWSIGKGLHHVREVIRFSLVVVMVTPEGSPPGGGRGRLVAVVTCFVLRDIVAYARLVITLSSPWKQHFHCHWFIVRFFKRTDKKKDFSYFAFIQVASSN